MAISSVRQWSTAGRSTAELGRDPSFKLKIFLFKFFYGLIPRINGMFIILPSLNIPMSIF